MKSILISLLIVGFNCFGADQKGSRAVCIAENNGDSGCHTYLTIGLDGKEKFSGFRWFAAGSCVYEEPFSDLSIIQIDALRKKLAESS